MVASKVSTKWIGGAFTVIVLAATAGFGGLNTVPTPPVPEIASGESFTGALLEYTPQRAVLIDELAETTVRPADGERLLVVIIDVENLDDEPRSSTSDESGKWIRVEGAPDVSPAVVRYDDSTLGPRLQPGVPATLVLTWAVPKDAFAAGDEIRLALPDATEFVGTSVVFGEYWDDITVGAYADLVAEDVGAGVDS